jgi:pimeloyl-ACP methyl ester carboxylesterase
MWRGCVAPLAAAGRRVIALDLPGFGNSAKPAPGAGFDYSLDAYAASLERVLFGALKLPRGSANLSLVGHGVLGGTLAALLTSRCGADVRRLALLNAPLTAAAAAEVPQPLRFLTNPLLGPITAQNPLALIGTPLQSGGPFVVDGDDTAAYIAPALADSGAGWAAIAVAKGLRRDGAARTAEAVGALGARGADVALIWGVEDRWLGAAPPQEALPGARRLLLEGCGHFAAEDWADKVAHALLQVV